jgi:hypothetical protein
MLTSDYPAAGAKFSRQGRPPRQRRKMSFAFFDILSPDAVVPATTSNNEQPRAQAHQGEPIGRLLCNGLRLLALPASAPFFRLFAEFFIFRGFLPASRRSLLRPATPFFWQDIPPPFFRGRTLQFPELLHRLDAEDLRHRAILLAKLARVHRPFALIFSGKNFSNCRVITPRSKSASSSEGLRVTYFTETTSWPLNALRAPHPMPFWPARHVPSLTSFCISLPLRSLPTGSSVPAKTSAHVSERARPSLPERFRACRDRRSILLASLRISLAPLRWIRSALRKDRFLFPQSLPEIRESSAIEARSCVKPFPATPPIISSPKAAVSHHPLGPSPFVFTPKKNVNKVPCLSLAERPCLRQAWSDTIPKKMPREFREKEMQCEPLFSAAQKEILKITGRTAPIVNDRQGTI